jgi:hypothetical protein
MTEQQREPPLNDGDFWTEVQVALTPVIPFLWISLSGFMITSFYTMANMVWEWITRKIYCSLTIRSNDDIYKIVINFLTEKELLTGSLTQMKAQEKKKDWVWWWAQAKQEGQRPTIEYTPGPGTHFFSYEGKKIWAF